LVEMTSKAAKLDEVKLSLTRRMSGSELYVAKIQAQGRVETLLEKATGKAAKLSGLDGLSVKEKGKVLENSQETGKVQENSNVAVEFVKVQHPVVVVMQAWKAKAFECAVQLDAESGVRYAGMKQKWLDHVATVKFEPSGQEMLQVITEVAEWLVESIFNFVCEAVYGHVFDKVLLLARAQEAEVTLRKPISGSAHEIQEPARRFVEAFGVIHDLSSELGRRLLAKTLLDKLDRPTAKQMPTVEELAECSLDDLAVECAKATEKAQRGEPKKKVASAPTTVVEQQGKPAFQGKCLKCKVVGHKAADCKAERSSADKAKLKCAACLAQDDHTTRRCPEQTCLGCGAKGHSKMDCPPSKAGQEPQQHVEQQETQANKSSVNPCSGVVVDVCGSLHEEIDVAKSNVVCKIWAEVKGERVQVGLDSYAGRGMVLLELVTRLRLAVEPSNVWLLGVAEQPVCALGETWIEVTPVGTNVVVREKAVVVNHLPGDVAMLVSFSTMRQLGVLLTENGVRVAGQEVELAAGTIVDEEKNFVPSKEGFAATKQEGEREQKLGSAGKVVQQAQREEDWRERLEAKLHRGALHELRASKRKYGARGVTFSQLEEEGAVLWTDRDDEGRPIFQMAPGAADERLEERPGVQGTVGSAVETRTRKHVSLKQAKKDAKRALKQRRAGKKERRHAEFVAATEELEQLAQEREAALQFAAMKVAAQATVGVEHSDWEQVPHGVVSQTMEQEGDSTTWVSVAAAVASQDAPRTVRAAETIERYAKTGEWARLDTEGLVGSEQLPEIVDVDEYCLPELPNERQEEEFDKLVREKVAATKYSEAGKRRYEELLRTKGKKVYLIAMEAQDFGKLKVPKLQLHVTDGPVLRDKRRPMMPEDEQWLKDFVTEMDKMGVTFKPDSSVEHKVWASNPVVVKEWKGEDIKVLVRRLCIDYWMLHGRLKMGPQRVPLMSEFGDRVHNAKLWDADDGFSGYYQYPLDEASQLLTGFYTPLGIRCFRSMPMGIAVAPEKWNTAMAEIFSDVPMSRMFTYMDDFFRFTNQDGAKTEEELECEHLDLFELFLDKVGQAGLKLKLAKAKHGQTEIVAMGQHYGNGERWKSEKTTEIINNYPTPVRGKQLLRFLSIGNYYSDYVDNFAGRVARLRVLANKKHWSKNDFAEGSQERQDFEAIRAALVEQTRLALPDWTKTFVVKSDWSKEAMGAVLLQRDEHGKLRPLLFCSRKCTAAEAGVSAPDGELLALVNAVRKFEKYLMGRKFEAYVDQGSLGWMKDKKLSSINNRRLQGAFAYLRQFVFDLFYRPAKDMQDADAMSRIKHENVSEVEVAATVQSKEAVTIVEVFSVPDMSKWMGTVSSASAAAPTVPEEQAGPAQVELEGLWGFNTELRDLGAMQQTDDEVVAIRQLMAGKKLKEVEVVPTARSALAEYLSRDPACADFVEGQDGRLYHVELVKGKSVRQVVVPVACRGRLVVMKHAAQGHRDAEEVLAKLRQSYFWPSMRADVVAWIGACGCKRKKAERSQKVGSLQSLKVQRPGQRVTFDLFGPLPQSEAGNKYVLVMMDVGTREVMLEPLPSKEAKPIARKLFERVYLRGMTPEVWQSDLAKEFVGNIMKELAAILGAEFRHSSPYHPQTNTHVERFNKTLATQLSLMIKRADQTDWDQYLKFVEYAQLVGAHSALGRVSPLFLRGGWEALDPIDLAMGVNKVVAQDKDIGQWIADLQTARQIAMQSQEQALLRQQRASGNRRAKERDVDVGDTVWVMFPNVEKGLSKKLAFRMHGPYVVKKWLHGGHRVAVLAHQDLQEDTIVVHVDRMVRKQEVPKRLMEQWKPVKLVNAVPQPKQVAAEKKTLADPDLEIDHIVARAMVLDEPKGKKKSHDGWQCRVRFVGYGPADDEWYWEEDLMETAPEVVQKYLEKLQK
jgi:transposase InsO family protein